MSQHSNYILPLYNSHDIEIASAQDCYLFDLEGNKYIDFESGVWCVNLGHCNEKVNAVIHQQIDEVVNHGYNFFNRFAEDLSKELLNTLGLIHGKSVFLSSGSEAVNLAITIAKNVSGRNRILSLENCYLSAYGHGERRSHNHDSIKIEMDDFDSIEHIDFSKIAAFVFEPGTSRGTVTFPKVDFITDLVNRARAHGCLVIADEVTTGFGRSGKWFGHQHYDMLPDIVATGKGLGNGYPISAVSLSETVSKLVEEKGMRYAQSHQNDPLGCAIGLAVIKELTERNLIERSIEIGLYFKNSLEVLRLKHDAIQEVRGRGLMLAMEFHADTDIKQIADELFESGFVVGTAPNVIRFMPPLTLEKDDINRLIEKIDQILMSR